MEEDQAAMPASGTGINDMDEFDYAITGAGSTGCVLANRLSADGRHKVALIEAGGSDLNFRVQMSIRYGKTFFHNKLNWKYLTEPVPGLDGRQSYWPRVIGGSGSINAMVFIRDLAQDFDDWHALGNPGCAYEDVLPLFKRMEDNLSVPAFGKDAGSGSKKNSRAEIWSDLVVEYFV